jgi:hypothetical protein
VKIYVIAVKALREKERQDETQFSTKIDGKTSLGPSYRKIFARGIWLVMRMMMNTHVERFCERDLREGFVTDYVDDARLLVTMMMGLLRR